MENQKLKYNVIGSIGALLGLCSLWYANVQEWDFLTPLGLSIIGGYMSLFAMVRGVGYGRGIGIIGTVLSLLIFVVMAHGCAGSC